MTGAADPDAARPACASDVPRIELSKDLHRAVAEGHPWIYRDHLPPGFRAPAGTWVRVHAGGASAIALFDPGSPLSLRLFSKTVVPGAEWFATRIREAHELRERTGVTRDASAYRWIAGEGDGIPGLTVDRYGAFAVVVLDTDALAPYLSFIVDGMQRTASLHGIVRRSRAEGTIPLEVLSGRAPPETLVVEEHGVRFRADLSHGQKTGLFLDQRENRRFVGGLASGCSVLNLFGYTGGFSVHAALGGATEVTTVDVAAEAVSAARENFRLNGLDPAAHEFVAEDVFDYLTKARQAARRFDVVVCDPPSFARSRAHRDRATQAYVRLHAAALAVTKLGGFFAASSCSTQIGVEAFHGSLRAAAARARVRLVVCHDAGHAPDHPIAVGHPEGRYLKFVVSRVLAEA